MGQILGGVTDAIGLTNYKGEKKAMAIAADQAATANAMSKEQIDMAKEQLAFNREQYADWKDIYGDVQENLGNYYKTLTPDKLVTLGLENQQREYQQVKTSIERDNAQRGISGSGTELFLNNSAAVQNATARAAIRSSGQDMANNEKMKFLGIGLGQGTALLGNTNNAAANVTNSFSTGINSRTTLANNYLNAGTQLSLQNQKTSNDLFGMAVAGATGTGQFK